MIISIVGIIVLFNSQVSLEYGLYLYDTMAMYLDILNDTQYTGEDPTSGKLVFDRLKSRIIYGDLLCILLTFIRTF